MANSLYPLKCKKIVVSDEKLEEIAIKFGRLLSQVGIDKFETCILDQFDKDKFSFHCNLKKANNCAKISLRWRFFLESEPEFRMDYQNESRVYEYYESYKNKTASLSLQQYTIKNTDHNNSCHRFLSVDNASFTVQNDAYRLSLAVTNPENREGASFNEIFRLKNEVELQQYLLGLTFPLEIMEVYKKICDISMGSIGEYPKFDLEIKRKIDQKQLKTTDMISLRYGSFNQFTVTKNEKTITIDSFGNWSYNSPQFDMSQTKNGNINYGFNSVSLDTISSFPSLMDQLNEVNQEVDQVKTLTKSILKR